MTRNDLIDRREIIFMFPNMTLRKYKRTRIYRLLKIHEIHLTRKLVVLPRKEVSAVLKSFRL